eukprot:7598300-Alexandrium_andersonii.AAC.1
MGWGLAPAAFLGGWQGGRVPCACWRVLVGSGWGGWLEQGLRSCGRVRVCARVRVASARARPLCTAHCTAHARVHRVPCQCPHLHVIARASTSCCGHRCGTLMIGFHVFLPLPSPHPRIFCSRTWPSSSVP